MVQGFAACLARVVADEAPGGGMLNGLFKGFSGTGLVTAFRLGE